mmetsp:Transcript_72191/g.234496  ORF Transcript_72191/g.234496 Transcript_72191/m.234496 type:complete len:291 (+) Transcript_72191:851-1723(+)
MTMGNRTENDVPTSSSDSTLMLPPWALTNSFAIERPKPMPWWPRIAELSSCSKGWKMRSKEPLWIPLPVSVTLTSTHCFSGSTTPVKVILPSFVNLQAFVTRLKKTWVHLWVSASMMGKEFTSFISCTLVFTRGRPPLSEEHFTNNTTSSKSMDKSTGSRDNLLVGAGEPSWVQAMVAISMIFITRSKSLFAQVLTSLKVLNGPSCFSVSHNWSSNPMMPYSGLRSSCDTTAMNRIFRCSASLYAATSVKSQPTRETPLMSPRLFFLGTALNINMAFFVRNLLAEASSSS